MTDDAQTREQLLAELQALKESEARYRLLAENATDLILLTSPEGQVRYASPSSITVLGQPPEALQGLMSYEFIHPDDFPVATQAHLAALSGTPMPPVSYRILRKDGGFLWLEVIKKALVDPATGEPVVLSISRDVTERKQAQIELEQAYLMLREADLHKDEFLSVISHELRTPLNFISGFASILQEGLAGPLNSRQSEYLGKILEGSDRMLALVRNLLDVSRMQAGKFQVSTNRVFYPSLVAEAVTSLYPLAQRRGQRIEMTGIVELEIEVDAERIIQVLTNLLDNAIKFSDEGGAIQVKAFLSPDGLVTEVSDDGIGIAPEDAAKLFGRFRQVRMGSTREAGGAGLGLSICRAIVEAHGGSVGLRSEPGVGSTFYFVLPTRR